MKLRNMRLIYHHLNKYYKKSTLVQTFSCCIFYIENIERKKRCMRVCVYLVWLSYSFECMIGIITSLEIYKKFSSFYLFNLKILFTTHKYIIIYTRIIIYTGIIRSVYNIYRGYYAYIKPYHTSTCINMIHIICIYHTRYFSPPTRTSTRYSEP